MNEIKIVDIEREKTCTFTELVVLSFDILKSRSLKLPKLSCCAMFLKPAEPRKLAARSWVLLTGGIAHLSRSHCFVDILLLDYFGCGLENNSESHMEKKKVKSSQVK
jgi:hypothetical protein